MSRGNSLLILLQEERGRFMDLQGYQEESCIPIQKIFWCLCGWKLTLDLLEAMQRHMHKQHGEAPPCKVPGGKPTYPLIFILPLYPLPLFLCFLLFSSLHITASTRDPEFETKGLCRSSSRGWPWPKGPSLPCILLTSLASFLIFLLLIFDYLSKDSPQVTKASKDKNGLSDVKRIFSLGIYPVLPLPLVPLSSLLPFSSFAKFHRPEKAFRRSWSKLHHGTLFRQEGQFVMSSFLCTTSWRLRLRRHSTLCSHWRFTSHPTGLSYIFILFSLLSRNIFWYT